MSSEQTDRMSAHRMSKQLRDQIMAAQSNGYNCTHLSFTYTNEIADELERLHAIEERLVSLANQTCDLCTHHGSSPESIEDFDRTGEDQWIADLWREARAAQQSSATEGAEKGGGA